MGGFLQSSHEVILQSKWNLGIAVLIAEGHCQDKPDSIFFFMLSLYIPAWADRIVSFISA